MPEDVFELRRPLVMGILNVTPDSFSDGGHYLQPEPALRHAERLVAEGADIIDVGGESTRPGAAEVPAVEQIHRTQSLIAAIRARHPQTAVSIDTRLAEVARAAVQAGAEVVNDVSALRHDPAMAACVAESGARVVLMHMQGTPQTMQRDPQYTDVVTEVKSFLARRSEFAVSRGIARERIILDPGIGFGKTVAHNLGLLGGLQELTQLGPVLLGVSRKSFIGAVLDLADPADRLTGTIVTQTIGLLAGVRVLRAHDVREARQAVDLCVAWRQAQAER